MALGRKGRSALLGAIVAAAACWAPAAASADALVAAAGDIACDPASGSFNSGLGTSSSCRQAATARLIAGQGYATVLGLGDMQYEAGEYPDFLTSYDLSWGAFRAQTHPAVGNHEYGTPGADGYFDYFDGVGIDDGPAGVRGAGYYSFNVGRWHLIALNSNCGRVSCAAGSPQEQWLRADLAATRKKCVLAYWHHPRYSSGEHGSSKATTQFWRDLYKAHADVVLSGHDHDYERFAQMNAFGRMKPDRGIREFVVGTGGKSHYGFDGAVAGSKRRIANRFGILRLKLRKGRYAWRFLREGTGAVLDSGRADCV
jgi:hypothetical protein